MGNKQTNGNATIVISSPTPYYLGSQQVIYSHLLPLVSPHHQPTANYASTLFSRLIIAYFSKTEITQRQRQRHRQKDNGNGDSGSWRNKPRNAEEEEDSGFQHQEAPLLLCQSCQGLSLSLSSLLIYFF